MERLSLVPGISKFVRLGNGSSIRADVVEPPRPTLDNTTMHESIHIALSDGIVSATNIAHGATKGETVPKKLTAVAAAGPAAMGYDGVGWDLSVIRRLRQNVGSAMAAARAKIRGLWEETIEIARILQLRRIIGQPDVDEAREIVRKRRDGIHKVELEVTSPQGDVRVIELESYKNEVKVEDDLITFPKVA